MESMKVLKNVHYFDDDDELYCEYDVTFECKGKRFIAIHNIAVDSMAWNYKIIGYEPDDFQKLHKGGMELVDFSQTTFTEKELIEAVDLLLFSGKDELCYYDDDNVGNEEADKLRKEMGKK